MNHFGRFLKSLTSVNKIEILQDVGISPYSSQSSRIYNAEKVPIIGALYLYSYMIDIEK